MSRTVGRWTRFYASGYDLSGDVMDVGALAWDHPVEEVAGLNWEVNGGLPDAPVIGVGPLNTILNAQASAALHNVLATQATYEVMVPVGMRAAPAAGVPVFAGCFEQLAYRSAPGRSMTTITLDFAHSALAGQAYGKPWGVLLHAAGNETAVNSAAGVDGLAATSAGGYMAYQVFAGAGSGSVVVKVQDSADNNSWADLSGATVSLAHTAIPAGGRVQIGTTATVRRYLRWQIVFTGMTGVNFALAFMRG